MPTDVKIRCSEALKHICDGLESANYLQTKKFEMEEKHRKAQEQYERDNPKMCKPMEAIPMPDKSDDDSKGELDLYESKRTQSENKNWHDDLKSVLFKKAILVYITISELNFKDGKFGQCVRNVKRAINCYSALCQLKSKNLGGNVINLLAFAYGAAGDAYMELAKSWDFEYVKFVENFNIESDEYDTKIGDKVEEYVDESQREWTLKVPKDVSENFFLALKCFRAAMDLYISLEDDPNETEIAKDTKIDIIGRYGNALNCTASLYINNSTSLIKKGDFDINDVEDILNEAIELLEEGIEQFSSINSFANIIILQSNLAMGHRTLAYARKTHLVHKLAKIDQKVDFDRPGVAITQFELDR